jgi:ribosomal-protein-alanine N-acetyltransferase
MNNRATYSDNLQAPRLTTRFLTIADAPAWVAYCSNPLATTYTALPGKTPEEMAVAFTEFTLARYKENRLGLQALILKETGGFIGLCGLLLQDVNGRQEVEIGYHLIRRHWGHGYASEAAQMFRNYGFENNFADSIISIIAPGNQSSKNVAMRNGMRLAKTGVEFKGQTVDLFRIAREEWALLNNHSW